MEQVRFVERRITTQKDLFTQFPVGIHGDPARIRQASQAGPEHKRYLKSGSHSSAYRVNLPDRPPEIVKVIHRLNPFSDLPSAIDFAHQIWDYGHILNDRMGIPTIVPHTVVIDSIDTGYYVQTMEEDGGTDFETSMGESNPHDCIHKAQYLFSIIGRLTEHPYNNLSSREDSALGLWLEVGIDLKPANILQKDPTSVPQYADLVPARMRKQNGDPEVELPAPLTRQGFDLAYWRAFNLNGLVTMTLSQLCRIRPELSHQFINTGYDFARQLGNAELLRYLDQFEGIRFLTANPRDRLTIIEQLPNHAMYAMRMIGCVVVAEQTSGTFPSDLLPVLLEEVHHLTHFGDDPASDADTAQAKHILTSLSQGRIPYLDDIIRS